MKVLQINSVCGIGSTGRIATDIHQILKSKGHESYIAYGRSEAINCEDTLRIGNRIDLYAHVASTRFFDKHGFGSKKSTRAFIQKIEKLNPDVIHLHNIHGYYLNVEILFDYLKKKNKPVVWTLHDCWSFTGHCTHFDYIECERWRDGCYACPQKKKYPMSNFSDNSKNNFNEKNSIFNGIKNLVLVAPSEWLANLVEKSFLKDYQLEVINNGIDLKAFKPIESDFRKEYNILNKFIILGVASVWNRRKGLNFFIELAKKLNDDEVIALVGLSEKQKRELPKNIIGFTRTNNIQELAEIYSVADVFVNPTLEDNFPTTNLEAIACGTPVITFETGGSVESIDEKTGVIVRKGELKELAQIINSMKSKTLVFEVKDLLKNAKVNYDKEKKTHEYLMLYEQIFNK